jgi:hypothetical protein
VTGAYAFEPVTQVYRHQDPVKVRLTLEDPATGATEVVETTPEHPFYVPGLGFVEAAALTPGDPVSRAPSAEPPAVSVVRLINLNDLSDTLRVKALTLELQSFWAYNLEVAQDHTFFVGASRAWVHNVGPGCSLFEAAAAKADEAQAAGAKSGVAAAFKAAGEEEVTTGLSSGAARASGEKVVEVHPELVKLEEELFKQTGQRSDFALKCAEISCLSQRLWQGLPIRGGTISTAKISGNIHGLPFLPCETCQPILNYYGITYLPW